MTNDQTSRNEDRNFEGIAPSPRQGQQHSSPGQSAAASAASAALGKDSHLAIALKGRHKEPAAIVLPLQGFESDYTRTQSDDKARDARIVWADMFLG